MAEKELSAMPRGEHPNSRANLEKLQGQFSNSDKARKAGVKSGESKRQKRTIADEFRALLDQTNKKGVSNRELLADKLMRNAEKSPEWYKLALKMAGEMPEDDKPKADTRPVIVDVRPEEAEHD